MNMEIYSQRKELKVAVIRNSEIYMIFVLGVPKSVKLTENAFRQCLFDHQPLNISVGSLMLNSDKQMSRVEILKRGLSDACTKVVVLDDKVTCKPLQKNGKLI